MKIFNSNNIKSYNSVFSAESFCCKINQNKLGYLFNSLLTSFWDKSLFTRFILFNVFIFVINKILYNYLDNKEICLVNILPIVIIAVVLPLIIQSVIALITAHSFYSSFKEHVFRFDKEGMSVLKTDAYGVNRKIKLFPWNIIEKVVSIGNVVGVFEKGNSRPMLPIFTLEVNKEDIPNIFSLWKEAQEKNYANDEIPIAYTKNEESELLLALKEHFGSPIAFYRQKSAEYIYANIVVFPPTNESPFYKISTLGAGARSMPTSVEDRLSNNISDACEYMIFLPKDWVKDEKEIHEFRKWWIVSMLGNMAVLPFKRGYAFSFGDVIQTEQMNHCLLLCPGSNITKTLVCTLSGGKSIEFFQFIQLTASEYSWWSDCELGLDEFLKSLFPNNKQEDYIDIQDIAAKNAGKK